MKRYFSYEKGFASRMKFDVNSNEHSMKTFIRLQLFLLLIVSYWCTTPIQAQDTTNLRNAPLPQTLHNSPYSSISNLPESYSSLAPTTLSQQPDLMSTSRLARATQTNRKRPFAATEMADSKTTPALESTSTRRENGESPPGLEENDEMSKQQHMVSRGSQRRKKKTRTGVRLEKDDYENDYTDQEELNGESPQLDVVDKKRRRRKGHIKIPAYDQQAASVNIQPRVGTNKTSGKKPNGKDQEYYDDYEDNETQKVTLRKPKQSTARAPTGAEIDSSSILEGMLAQNNSIGYNSTADIATKQQVDGRPDSLDARSPSGQLAAGIGKRITGMFGGDFRKSPRSTTTSPSSSISTTTEMPPTTTTRKSSGVVPTASDQIVSLGFNNATNLTLLDTLDWSNLVKVVMRSARDNRTLYTVVMNSSDLSSHPISDWSNEMPILLQRDFEKLIGKWSNIFPKQLLIEDLRNIMDNKSLVYTNQANQLNETILPPTSVNGSTINIASSAGISLQSPSNSSLDLVNNTNGNITSEGSSNTSFPVHLVTKSSFTSSSPGAYGLDINNQYRELGLAMSTAASVDRKVSSTDPTNIYPSVEPFLGSMDKSTLGTPATITNPSVPVTSNNKSVEEFMKSMNEEHSKMQHNVKEQMDSLRHYIMLSSVGIVLCTTLVVGLVIILKK